ncbi:MAG TPA: protein kinase [Bryobacteraceae bacterium]|nr:protein kinase [Bryobacteraceae bacterium]
MMTPEQWRQMEELYQAARECRPNERAALLECTDPEMRARIERMLEVESGSDILEHSGDGVPATQTIVIPGAQLGPYQIETQVGAGGMGTVYRAIDTRLGRVVAIKIAAERYSERFQREARAISTLNHPHICTLYDVGPNYLVMEFLEGSTLAAEIKKGPLGLENVARYGAQIANALAEAHALGIVHRDLKPSNIMLTKHGVKVLDFGLAKILSASDKHPETGLTETGGVMGTPAYMAPEQVEGREPSNVTDLFSLGLVLYEMVAGRLPYPGASLGQMLSSGSQLPLPSPSGDGSSLAPSLDGLIAKLLERDPAKRPQSAAEVARELSLAAEPSAAPKRGKWRSSRLGYAVAAAALLAALATGGVRLYRNWRAPENAAPIAANPTSYIQITSFTDSAMGPVLSNDGRMLAFYRSSSPFLTSDQIWVKLLPNGEPVQVTHDPRPKYNIAFSPDNSRIAYTAMENLFHTYAVSSLGGDSQLMLSNAAGLGWLDGRHVLFSQVKSGVHMGIVTGLSDRSELREIYFPAKDRGMAHYSYLSPDRKWVLLVEMDPAWQPCRVVPFSGGSVGRQVGPPGAPCSSAAWSPDGKWMYLGVRVDGRYHLWRQRFPDGKPEQITFGSTEEGGIAVEPDGRSLITSIITLQRAVWIHDARGDRALSSEGYAVERPPVFSRDGKRLYYLLRHDSPNSPAELCRADLDSGRTEVLFPGVSISEYDISDDEKDVVFATQPAGRPSQLWIAPLDRTSPPRRISASGEANPYFGPNGDVLFRLTENNAFYLGAMTRDGARRRKVLPLRFMSFGRLSPDRRFIAAGAALSGDPYLKEPGQVFVALDGSAATRFCDNACTAVWSPDGRYFYIEVIPASRENPTGRTLAIPIPPGESLPPIPPAAVHNLAEWAKVPGVKIVDHNDIAPSSNPSTYAYIQSSVHANLFRIPLR